MFYLLLTILFLGGLYPLLNGEWVFRIQQDRKVGVLPTLGSLALAIAWDLMRVQTGVGLPGLYPLVAVMGGMLLGFLPGMLAGAGVAGVATGIERYLRGGQPGDVMEYLISAMVLYMLIGAITGRFSDRLRGMAFTDSLTALHNRRYFFEELEPEVARAVRYGFPLSVLIVDLDYFKAYNDRLGHMAGDMALRRFADVLRTGSREGDLIARYGGEEFIIALSHTDGEAARQYAERLRENVETLYDHGPVQLTISIGIASVPGYKSVDALVQAADSALYQAKGQRNHVVLAEPQGDQPTGEAEVAASEGRVG